MALGDATADYIQKTTLAGVAPCSEKRNRSDTAEARMKEPERSSFPNNVHIRFAGTKHLEDSAWGNRSPMRRGFH